MALSERFKTESFHWDLVQSYGILTRVGKGSTGVTAGKLLQHCIAEINYFRQHIGQKLCVFKIGVTSNPLCRFCAYLEKGFTAMTVLAVSNNVDHIHMLEAACISQFAKDIGCKNAANSGGEGALNRMDTEPPFFLYVTGGRADQGRWAPASHVVDVAKAEVLENPQASRAVRQMAAINDTDAESGVHKVFREHGLVPPVPISQVDLGVPTLRAFPIIRLRDWGQYLLNAGLLWRQMTGCDTFEKMNAVLAEFWNRMRSIFPNHGVYQLASEGVLELQNTIPIYSHTDEGRSLKKNPILVISTHGVLGIFYWGSESGEPKGFNPTCSFEIFTAIFAEMLNLLRGPAELQGYGNFNCLAMEFLGKSLEDHVQMCGGRFKPKTACLVAQQARRSGGGVVDLGPGTDECGKTPCHKPTIFGDFGD
ncbi:unnamed protein product [Cladocopium goreaui]|uniref:Uncharacterized protein n=1 Tax=Cladocopium goreaui TaxID=2562237 RepID=A0A9P1C5Y2_9DINO|nr:unnamed protein product [Cladocopium goreaui]